MYVAAAITPFRGRRWTFRSASATPHTYYRPILNAGVFSLSGGQWNWRVVTPRLQQTPTRANADESWFPHTAWLHDSICIGSGDVSLGFLFDIMIVHLLPILQACWWIFDLILPCFRPRLASCFSWINPGVVSCTDANRSTTRRHCLINSRQSIPELVSACSDLVHRLQHVRCSTRELVFTGRSGGGSGLRPAACTPASDDTTK